MPGRQSAIRRAQRPDSVSLPGPVDAPVCKPYLSISELAKLTPWTDQAIRTMLSRGIFREGEHYFYVRLPSELSNGLRSWHSLEHSPPPERVPHYREQLDLWHEGAKSGTKPARSK